MERAVDEGRLEVDHGVAGHDAAGERVADALLDGAPELARHRAAHDLRLELEAGATLERLELQDAWPYWPLPPVWRTKRPSALGRAADRLAVADLRPADVGLHLELAQHAVDDHLEVQLAHAGDAGLGALLVGADRKVGLGRRCSAIDILSWSALVFGSTASSMTGSGKVIDSSTIGLSSADSVSPVVVFLRPTAAAMSPALTDSISSRWLACSCRRRPTRSFPFVPL